MWDNKLNIQCNKLCSEHTWYTISNELNDKVIHIAVVYMATCSSNQTIEWNNKIRKCLFTDITNIETNGGERICIVGDFNAHISETNDKEDKEGYELKAFCASKNLHILNTTEKCKGMRTWQRGTSSSCIDYVLTNNLEMEL